MGGRLVGLSMLQIETQTINGIFVVNACDLA